MEEKATINADDADLEIYGDADEAPTRLKRFLATVLAPLVPLANAAVRLRMEVAAARFATELAKEKRKRLAAELKASAEAQKSETIAKMHAQVIAMLDSEIAIHAAAVKRVAER